MKWVAAVLVSAILTPLASQTALAQSCSSTAGTQGGVQGRLYTYETGTARTEFFLGGQ
jgi:hypothetical protein